MTFTSAIIDAEPYMDVRPGISLPAYLSPEHQPFYWQGNDVAALMVHGFPGTPAEMRPVAHLLHQAGWTVQGLLLPGFGAEIRGIGEQKWLDWVAKVEEAVVALTRTHRRVILVGNSMGGALCLNVAAKGYGDALLLFAPFWRVANRLIDALYPLARFLLPKIRPFVRADFEDESFRVALARVMPDADLDDLAVQAAIRKVTMPISVLGQIRAAGRAGFEQALHVYQPSTIIQGAEDDVVTSAQTQRVAARLPNLAALWQVAGGHDIALMDGPNRQAMAALIQNFVDQSSGPGHTDLT